MPNWCDNDLTISGPEKDVRAFFDEAFGKWEKGEPLVLDFNKFVPHPGTITRDMIHLPAYRDSAKDIPDGELGYHWRLQHWGTKWQPEGFDGENVALPKGRLGTIPALNGEAEVMMNFFTAWTPPLPVVVAMSKQFPTLKFKMRYYEGGTCFKGLFVCKRGEVKVNKVREYSGRRGG